MNTKKRMRTVAACLVPWYWEHKRILPWREKKDAYCIWISEIMLQQTRIEAVLPYYNRFIGELPDIKALASVSDERLLKLWEGLGYYSRARNLKKAAEIIIDKYGGQLPADFELLKSLPGIGPYTAGAICSIAYNIPAPAVDGNVLRVLSRILTDYEDVLMPSARKRAEALLTEIMPKDAGDFNEALMEIGETICLPKKMPLCSECPISKHCLAYEMQIVSELPVRIKKTKRRIEEKTVFIIEYEDTVVIKRRPETGLLAGLYEFPNIEGFMDIREASEYLSPYGDVILKRLPDEKHIFSHVEWRMLGYIAALTKPPSDPAQFVKKEKLVNTLSLPGAFQTYYKYINME